MHLCNLQIWHHLPWDDTSFGALIANFFACSRGVQNLNLEYQLFSTHLSNFKAHQILPQPSSSLSEDGTIISQSSGDHDFVSWWLLPHTFFLACVDQWVHGWCLYPCMNTSCTPNTTHWTEWKGHTENVIEIGSKDKNGKILSPSPPLSKALFTPLQLTLRYPTITQTCTGTMGIQVQLVLPQLG